MELSLVASFILCTTQSRSAVEYCNCISFNILPYRTFTILKTSGLLTGYCVMRHHVFRPTLMFAYLGMCRIVPSLLYGCEI